MAGRFIHHNPTDEEGKKQDVGVVPRTVAAMKAHGITVDEALWGHHEGRLQLQRRWLQRRTGLRLGRLIPAGRWNPARPIPSKDGAEWGTRTT